ncbi:MAG: beta-CASP ribonuclease aCPSF1 [Nanoarchaeota archaeon]
MTNILDEITKQVKDSKENISDIVFEGANIIIYTKNKEFFLKGNNVIMDIVNTIKKRVELRPDPSITMSQEKAEKMIRELIPSEAGISNIIFDQQRSQVIIEAEKPGLAIGKQGELLRSLRENILWVPFVQRAPSIRSKIMENIRYVLYENSDFRRKFLHKVGKRIYDDWKHGERKTGWVRVSFLGASRFVGRSCFLLQTPESKIMIDCGIDPSKNQTERYPMLEAPEFNIQDLDAVVISHSHIDHIALVPYLYKMGYTGPVYCTAPVRDVGALLMLDTISIAEKDGDKVLYSSTDIKDFVKHTICLDYEEVTDITPDVRLTFFNAGHTLGSALVHFNIGNGYHNYLYTGDFLYENTNLLQAAVTRFPRLETVMMESTYGSKDDLGQPREIAEEKLIKIIKETYESGGKVLMPVLGVGRSQEMMLIIEKSIRLGKLPKMPVYVQGMVWDITAIHTAYPDFFNPTIKRNIFHKDQNPLMSDIFKKVTGRKEQQEIIDSSEPCIIIATSGMMEGGAITEYFKQLSSNPKHSLILSCYQANGTLGRKLQEGNTEINVGTADRVEMIPIRLKIHTMVGFSGHSSRQQLMNWVRNLDPRPKKIIIIHGEQSKTLDLASSIHKQFGIETTAPRLLDTIRLK